MKESQNRIVYGILALLFIVAFLCLPYFTFKGEGYFGIEFLGDMRKFELNTATLSIIMPIIAILLAFIAGAGLRVIGALGTFIPTIMAITDFNDYTEPAAGFYICALLNVALLIVSFIYWVNPETISPQKQTQLDIQKRQQEIRQYNLEQLNNIINDSNITDQQLIEECQRELNLRINAESFRAELLAKDDYELNEILTNPSLYNAAMVYCCELILAERRQKYEAEQAKLREEERQHRAEEEKARLEKEDTEGE